MSKKNTEKKINAIELLSTYSVDSIINIFKQINKRITALIDSSGEDFLQLHARFKQVYELILQVTSSANKMLDSFSNNENILFVNRVVTVIDNLKITTETLYKRIDETISQLNEIEKVSDHLFIPINNYNQDLKTLSLLSANLKLDSETLNYARELNSIIEKISVAFPNLLSQHEKLKQNIVKAKNTISTLDSNYLKSIFNSIDYFREFTQYIHNKYMQAQKLKPVLEEKISKTSEHTSKIITNLQYQDIVKQKIEHIEQSHIDILEKLTGLSGHNNHPDYIVNKAKILIQVRDVASLQAAQLVYANKEYQNAIEIITNKYLDLVDMIEEITQMCRHVCQSGQNKAQMLEGEPEYMLNNAASLNNDFEAIGTIFRLTINTTKSLLNSFSKSSSELQKYAGSLHDHIIKIGKKVKSNNTASQIIRQMTEVSEEFIRNINQIQVYADKNLSLLNQLKRNKQKTTNNKGSDIALLLEDLEKSIRIIGAGDDTIFSHFKSNYKQCELTPDLLNSIQQVKYYDFFAEEIEQIILALNEISKKLHIEEGILKNANKETFESLKKRYTVKSEYIVHEHISNESLKGSVDLFSNDITISSETDDDENGNLELF